MKVISMIEWQLLEGWRDYTMILGEAMVKRGPKFAKDWATLTTKANIDGSPRSIGALMAARAALGIAE